MSYPRRSLGWLVEVYLESVGHQYRGTKETIEAFQKILQELKQSLGAHKDVENQIRRGDIIQWIDNHEGWSSANTKVTNYNKINQMFRWAEQIFGLTNPLQGVRSSDRPWDTDEKTGFMPVSDDHFKILLQHCTPRFARLLRFMLLTGCTPMETRELKWNMVEETRIQLSPTRVLLMMPEVAQILDDVRMEAREKGRYSDDGWVFTTRSGKPWSRQTLDGEFRRVKNQALLPGCSLFGLRKAYYQKGLDRGLHPEQVAAMAGLKSPAAIRGLKPQVIAQDEEKLAELYAKMHGTAPVTRKKVPRKK
jgi:integrase